MNGHILRLMIAILLLTLCVAVNGQEATKAYLFDEFANVFCTDPLRARIDGFFAEVYNRPESIGYVVVTPDAAIPGRSERYVALIENNANFRNFDVARIRFQETEFGESTHFQFWVVPKGAQLPYVDRPSERNPITATTLFDSSRIDSIKKGQVRFGEGFWSGEPCDLGLNLSLFAATLDRDSSSVAYLIASAKNRRQVAKAKTALRLTANALGNLHKIPRRRIKTVYVGIRGESEMQLWLVPKGGRVPKFRAGLIEQ